MGFHGGQVHLRKDPNQSGKTGDVLADVSMGGSKARRFLSNHDQKQLNAVWECWKQLCEITTSVASNPEVPKRRIKVWMLLDNFFRLLRKQEITVTFAQEFKEAIISLIEAIKVAWGEKDITYYLHILCIHGPFFVEKQGPLAIWSTQGMEKSHYQARTSYFRCTRHGGGQIRTNALVELYNWFYRRQICRLKATKHTEN